MSNSNRIQMIAIALLVLGIVGPGVSLAKGPPSVGDIVVDSATPNFAEQGELNKAIVLAGNNFPTYSKVKFLRGDVCDYSESSDVIVVQELVKRVSTTELDFNIDVPTDAALGDYDICVYETDRFGTLSGRKGKGTTKLFSVREKGNPNTARFTPVEISAEVYEAGSSDAVEYASPYVGEGHPWTGTGQRQGRFDEGAYNFDAWQDNELQDVPRRCQVTYAGNPPTGGRYDCFGPDDDVLNHGGLISIPLAGITWKNATYSSKGDLIDDQGLCGSLTDGLLNQMEGDFLEFGATRYSLWFYDGCPNEYGGCPIEVRMLSYSAASGRKAGGTVVQLHPFHDLAGYPEIGRMSLTGLVYGMPGMGGLGEDELNVFTQPQDLWIGRFSMSFYAVKTGALVATCETEPFGDDVNIRIRTAPAP